MLTLKAAWNWTLDLISDIISLHFSFCGWVLNVVADCYNLPTED